MEPPTHPSRKQPCALSTASPPRVLLAVARHYPTIHEAVMKAGGERGWRMRFAHVLLGPLPPPEKYDGIVLIGGTPEILAWAKSAACPVVRIFDSCEKQSFPVVDDDAQAVGRLGAKYFIELGYRNLVFQREFSWNDGAAPHRSAMCDGFMAEAAQAGRTPVLMEISRLPEARKKNVTACRTQREDWLAEQLGRLPMPMAIMAEKEVFAPEIVSAARLMGLRIPEDVAVLAPSDLFPDHLSESAVPMSFVESGTATGAVAMALLGDLMAGKPAPKRPVMIPPRGIRTRASTAFFVSEVPGITETVLFIRTHFRERILVKELARRIGISERKLQTEFKRALGRTISEELSRMRMAHAEHLLAQTDLKITSVAGESGFSDDPAFYRAFRQAHGMTPGEYRQVNAKCPVPPYPVAP